MACAGILPWVQRRGGINALLGTLETLKPAKLAEHFNGIQNVDDLLTNLTPVLFWGLKSDGTVDPTVASFDLIHDPWLTRFRNAGLDPDLQAAQVETARRFVDDTFKTFMTAKMPLLRSEREVALGLDLIIQFGTKNAESIYTKATASLPADSQQLLSAISAQALSVLKGAFSNSSRQVRSARDRGNFLRSTPILSDLPFVPDGAPTPAPSTAPPSDLNRFFLDAKAHGNEHLLDPLDGSAGTPFIGGKNALAAMQKDMQDPANQFIYMLNWHCDSTMVLDSGVAANLGQVLVDRVQNGHVQLRAMFWAGPLLESILPQGVINGATAALLNALPVTPPTCDAAVILDSRTAFAGTHHQKLLVIGRGSQLIAYVGGVEYNRDRLEANLPGELGLPYFDITVKLEGPAAWLALQVFLGRWTNHPDAVGRPPLLSATMFPTPPTATPGPLRVQVNQTLHRKYPYENPVRTAQAALSKGILEARKFFYIEDQYFVGNPDLTDAIARALAPPRTRVGIVVITPDEFSTDLKGGAPFRRREFLRSIRERVQQLCSPFDKLADSAMDRLLVFERIGDSTVPSLPGQTSYVHCKLLIVDDEAAFVGSVNMNNRGWTHDTEIDATMVDVNGPGGTAVGSRGWVRDFRCRMWEQHLGIACTGDFEADLKLWRTLPALAHIRPFDLTLDPDEPFLTSLMWNSLIDPA